MSKIPKRIEIVRTNIVPFGSMSQATAERVKAALEPHYEQVGITIIGNVQDLDRLIAEAPDLVYVGFKRFPPSGVFREGEDVVWVPEYLDKHGITYTGSPREALELELSKERAKLHVHEQGVMTAPHFTAEPGQFNDAAELPVPFPLFIKPLRLGQGIGVDEQSVVHDFDAFQKKVQAIHDESGAEALVESYLSGREFSVAILADDQGELEALPIEIVAEADENGNRILGFKSKKEDKEQLALVTEVDVHNKVADLAKKAFQALGARDYGRIDVRMDAAGTPNFLEANLVPGPGYFPKACYINKGMDYETVINAVASLGLKRQK